MWQAEGWRLSATVISPYLHHTLSNFSLLIHSLLLASIGDVYSCMIMVTGVTRCCLSSVIRFGAVLHHLHVLDAQPGLVLWYYSDKIPFIIHSGVLEVIRRFSPATKNRLMFSISWIFICIRSGWAQFQFSLSFLCCKARSRRQVMEMTCSPCSVAWFNMLAF